ncbi:MAG: hypothetical protein ABIH65_03130 [Nanoarchaeota archaeon]
MVLDYVTIGISLVIFSFYLMAIFLSINIKRKLTKEVGITFVYIIIALVLLIIIRLQQIFIETEIMKAIPYFIEFSTLIFSVIFFIAIFIFYKNLKKVGNSRRSASENFKDYKKNLGRKIIK